MIVALDYLAPLEIAQLRHCRPDLFRYPQCGRCHNGQVVASECVQCGAEHDSQGHYLMPVVGSESRLRDAYHSFKRKKFK